MGRHVNKVVRIGLIAATWLILATVPALEANAQSGEIAVVVRNAFVVSSNNTAQGVRYRRIGYLPIGTVVRVTDKECVSEANLPHEARAEVHHADCESRGIEFDLYYDMQSEYGTRGLVRQDRVHILKEKPVAIGYIEKPFENGEIGLFDKLGVKRTHFTRNSGSKNYVEVEDLEPEGFRKHIRVRQTWADQKTFYMRRSDVRNGFVRVVDPKKPPEMVAIRSFNAHDVDNKVVKSIALLFDKIEAKLEGVADSSSLVPKVISRRLICKLSLDFYSDVGWKLFVDIGFKVDVELKDQNARYSVDADILELENVKFVIPKLIKTKCRGILGSVDHISQYYILHKLLDGKEVLIDRTDLGLESSQKTKRSDHAVMFSILSEAQYFKLYSWLREHIRHRDLGQAIRAQMGVQGEKALYHHLLNELAFIPSS